MKSASGITKITAALMIVVVIVVAAASVYFLQTPSVGPPPPPTKKVLRVITRHDTAITGFAYDKFLASDMAKRYGIGEVLFVNVAAPLWRDTIRTYQQRGEPFDVAWGGGPTLFDELVSSGLAAPLTRPDTLKVVSQIRDEIGGAPLKRLGSGGKVLWVAAAISSFGFIINYDIAERYTLPEPKAWEDLAGIELAKILPRPTVSYASPKLSTSHTRIYEIILQKFGWDRGWSILARMAANGRSYPGSVEALTAVQSGEVAVGIAIDFYGYQSEIQFPRTKYVLPFNQSIVNGDPIALLTTTKDTDMAQAFIEWILSVEGQKIWLHRDINRLPIREDLFKTAEGLARKDLYRNFNVTLNNIGIPFDDDLALKYEFALREYFDAAFVDPHYDLVSAWQKLTDAYTKGKISKARFEELAFELGKPLSWKEGATTLTFTQSYAISINEKIKEPATASEFAKIWRASATDRYRYIVGLIPS